MPEREHARPAAHLLRGEGDKAEVLAPVGGAVLGEVHVYHLHTRHQLLISLYAFSPAPTLGLLKDPLIDLRFTILLGKMDTWFRIIIII